MGLKPTRISILDPKSITPGIFKPITTGDTFEGRTNNLHDEGLYSTEIFGKMGSKERYKLEAYIDAKLKIFNPTYLKALIQTKSLYLGILKGSEYAIWDSKQKDFIKSNPLDGNTGFDFFTKHFHELVPPTTDSYKRKQRLELIEKNKDKATTNKVLVPPAGFRDIQFQPGGGVVENELTEKYRNLIFRTQVIANVDETQDNSIYDSVRWGIQNTFNEIDKYIFDLTDGKGGVFQRRVGTRGLHNGTRNVITGRVVARENLFDDNGVHARSVDMGLFQALVSFIYISIHNLVSGIINSAFTPGTTMARLIDKKSLNYEYVEVTPETVERFTSANGLTKLINGFSNPKVRMRPVEVNGKYLSLIYDDGKEVMVLSDIDDLPEGRDKKLVKPMTYIQLFYISCCDAIQEKYCQLTRYPVEGLGSIWPAEINIKTLTNAKPRDLVNEEGEVITRLRNFPQTNDKPDYYDAMSPDVTRYKLSGSDLDGPNYDASILTSQYLPII